MLWNSTNKIFVFVVIEWSELQILPLIAINLWMCAIDVFERILEMNMLTIGKCEQWTRSTLSSPCVIISQTMFTTLVFIMNAVLNVKNKVSEMIINSNNNRMTPTYIMYA